MASSSGAERNPHPILDLAAGLLPILTAVGGALWGLYVYIDHQHESQAQAAQQMSKDSRSRLIEAQRPFLEKQLELYFETAQVAGKLVSRDIGAPEWWDADKRFWALYWVELGMVEPDVVETAMKTFGDTLRKLEQSPSDPNLKSQLQFAALDLSHAIRSGIESSWGNAINPPAEANSSPK